VHGHLDATTDLTQVRQWFASHPDRNVAIATGAPGPDVLDIDQHVPAGNGFAALTALTQAGLLDGAAALVRTPSGGFHLYFTGTSQRNGHLPRHHLDFLATGGYVLAPPSRIGASHYQLLHSQPSQARLDWTHAASLLQPQPQPRQPQQSQAGGRDLAGLAAWVARQPAGNRNAGLFWAANRALETGPAADLGQLAAAARQAGLGDREITATLNSARHRSTQPQSQHAPEAAS
jgi:hypothetical protein